LQLDFRGSVLLLQQLRQLLIMLQVGTTSCAACIFAHLLPAQRQLYRLLRVVSVL
jgi:hypothetical protein